MKNDIPYNVVTFNEGDGSNTVHSSEANFEVANLKVLRYYVALAQEKNSKIY